MLKDAGSYEERELPTKTTSFSSAASLGKVWESVSSYRGTRDHPTDGNHGKTSILQFAQLIFLLLHRIGGVETKGIETKVTWGTIVFIHVSKGRETASFKERDPSEDLNHGFRQGIVGGNDLRDGLERELGSRDTEEFWDNESNSGQHCRSAMFKFRFTEPWEPLRGTLAKYCKLGMRNISQ